MNDIAVWVGVGSGILTMFVTIGIVLYLYSTGKLDSDDRD